MHLKLTKGAQKRGTKCSSPVLDLIRFETSMYVIAKIVLCNINHALWNKCFTCNLAPEVISNK